MGKQGIQKKKRKNNRKRLLSPIELPASLPALQLYAQLFSQSARNMCVFHFFVHVLVDFSFPSAPPLFFSFEAPRLQGRHIQIIDSSFSSILTPILQSRPHRKFLIYKLRAILNISDLKSFRQTFSRKFFQNV